MSSKSTVFRKTIGGQVVGMEPLHCETLGASDYCYHCGRDVVDLSPCHVLEGLRLKQIPDEDVLAFGCDIESLDPAEGVRCQKWCHRAFCPVTLHSPSPEPEPSP